MAEKAPSSRRRTFATTETANKPSVKRGSAPEAKPSPRSPNSPVDTRHFNEEVMQTALELARQRFGEAEAQRHLDYRPTDESIAIVNHTVR